MSSEWELLKDGPCFQTMTRNSKAGQRCLVPDMEQVLNDMNWSVDNGC